MNKKMNNETEQIFLLNSAESQTVTEQKINETPETAQVNLENVEDFSNVCRTCATITEFVIPIFDGEGLQNNLADKIHKHLPIQVSEQDLLPRVVCYQCANTLLAWHELVQCCVQADAALRTRLVVNVELADQEQLTSSNEASQHLEKEPKSEDSQNFYTVVKNVLTNYFHTLNMEEENLDFEFVCQQCEGKPTLMNIERLAEHLKSEHSTEVKCEDTIETFIRDNVTFEQILLLEESDSDREIESETKEKLEKVLPNFFCPFCESVFSSTTRLICHLNRHIELCIEDGVICCENVYNDKKSFVKHLQEQHVSRAIDDDAYVCRSCGFTADNANELEAHVTQSHGEGKTNATERVNNKKNNQKYIPAVCPECNRTFSNKYNMLVHMKSHGGDGGGGGGAYSCEKCNKSYRHRGNLTKHKRLVHEGVLSFVCPSCGEAFPTRGARDVHARLHSGARPYACRRCGNAYRAKNTLDRHLEVHLDVRKHQCPRCPRKFRRRTHLDYHLSTHERKT